MDEKKAKRKEKNISDPPSKLWIILHPVLCFFLIILGLCIGITAGYYAGYLSYGTAYGYVGDLMKKPVIYAYGYDTIDVTLDFDENTELTCAYPAYNGHWHFNMSSDKFLDSDRTYDYLYYEAVTTDDFDLSHGFCVKREDTIAFLEDSLRMMGLNDRESNDFITYWLPDLMKHKYNVISFQSKKFEEFVGLTVNPMPDSMIRVYMVWKGVDEPVEVEPQTIECTMPRQGKTIVEWGGTELK